MPGRIKLTDLPFGLFNPLSDNDGPSTDRRRTSPLEFLRMSSEHTFARDTLSSTDGWTGVVVASRLVDYAMHSNKDALFENYFAQNQQNADLAADSGLDHTYYAYKVNYINAKPTPVGSGDPTLITYPDIASRVPMAGPIPNGTIVSVKFDDFINLKGPYIEAIVSQSPIQLASFVPAGALGHGFKQGVPLTLDSAVPERKLLSGEIKDLASRRPDFAGQTPNADKLRAALTALGYKEKGNELSNGGDITAIMADVGIAVFTEIKKQLPDVSIIATGGNDKYHQVINDAGMYRSRHVDGAALDFVFAPVNEANKAVLLKILQGFSAANEPFRFKDEYKTLTSAASGRHFHFSYRSGGSEGLEEQAAAKELLAQGSIEGYTIG